MSPGNGWCLMGFENSGRRPQPAALKVLRGNPGKRKVQIDLRPPDGDVVKPEGLTPGASAMWDRLAPICLYMRTLTAADVVTFVRMCELEASWNANVAAKGTEQFSQRLELDLARELRPYTALFGLEPVSRARIQVPKQPDVPQSKWAGVLS